MPETLIAAPCIQCQHRLGQELELRVREGLDITDWVVVRMPTSAVLVGGTA